MPYYAVDRIEGRMAVVIGDDGSTHEVPRKRLPKGTGESSVLEVALDAAGRPQWASATLDAAEQERRITRARAILNELQQGDPGGDLEL